MPAERAGYTVTMFVVDVSPTMGKTRTVELPGEDESKPRVTTMTNLQWSLQYVMYKIQEMIFHGRKTDQCGVMLFGTEESNNSLHQKHGEYNNVSQYISIGQANARTLAKLASLEPSTVIGDPIDGVIAAIEAQAQYLKSKPSWTRKMVLVTDGQSPLELDSWEMTADKIKELNIQLSILGVDFDDEEFGVKEEDKTDIKRENERFWSEFAERADAVVGTCAFALQEVARPEPKEVKGTAMPYILRIGDNETDPETSAEIAIKVTKGTALVRPPSMKKFAARDPPLDEEGKPIPVIVDGEEQDVYAVLKSRTEFALAKELAAAAEAAIAEAEERGESPTPLAKSGWTKDVGSVEKETLSRSYKYGATWVDVEGEFEKLETKKGIDICAFFPAANLQRELLMSEVQFLWGDPASGKAQVEFSSIVQAMHQKELVAVSRWVTRDGGDPKMGILIPRRWENIDSMSWVQVPFADDLRKYAFRPLTYLRNRKGEDVTSHPYLPTSDQMDAMAGFVNSMDLMRAGEKDESGDRRPWHDPSLSFNPAVHRIKQALFHAAIVPNLLDHPAPPPHPDLTRYFEPPPKLLKRARQQLDTCRRVFNVNPVPKKVAKRKVEMHVAAVDDDDLILAPRKKPRLASPKADDQPDELPSDLDPRDPQRDVEQQELSETEPESDVENLSRKGGSPGRVHSLPTITRSVSPPQEAGPMELDRRIPEGRIIGTVYPLDDFKRNLSSGDVVTKAVEDFGLTIQELALQPFADRRHDELVNCLYEMRTTCLREDEIDLWNDSIRELKDVCLSSTAPNNPILWKRVQTEGASLGLITRGEAPGRSSVSDSSAMKFLR